MERIEKQVTLTRVGSFTRRAFTGWNDETINVYTMTDEDGKVYVWKTTAYLGMKTGEINEYGGEEWHGCNQGDIIVIKASVKGETEYKGQTQTELSRVSVKEIIFKAETYYERKERLEREKAERIEAQKNSLKDGDTIWTQMSYKQYKEHYSDCEIIEGSFERYRNGFCGVDVIIRAGRIKASGVRGEHFRGYEMTNELGERLVYRAVCEENALKRANKEYPHHEWTCTHVYKYPR